MNAIFTNSKNSKTSDPRITQSYRSDRLMKKR